MALQVISSLAFSDGIRLFGEGVYSLRTDVVGGPFLNKGHNPLFNFTLKGDDTVKKKKKQPCEETCKGYKALGIDACQGCAG